jgi:hypothetical protein
MAVKQENPNIKATFQSKPLFRTVASIKVRWVTGVLIPASTSFYSKLTLKYINEREKGQLNERLSR